MSSDISSKAILGQNCHVGKGAIIHDNVIIGDNVIIETNAIIGYDHLTHIYDPSHVLPRLVIGNNCLIRAGAILYSGSEIENDAKIGHNAIIREGMRIGDHTVIGSAVVSEGYTKIGSRCVIYSQCHLTPFMIVEDYVFFGPGVITMSDPAAAHYRPQINRTQSGPRIGRAARIGSGSVLPPGVTVGEEAFIGAGSVIACNIPAHELWAGSPARKVRDIRPDEKLQAVG